MAFRDNAKEYFEQTDYYQELTDSEKTEFLETVTSNRREFLNFLDTEPNFQGLNLDERKEFLSIIDPQNYAVEPEPEPEPEPTQGNLTASIPERAQDKLAIEDPWDKPISNVVKRAMGSLADTAAGALQLGSDFTTRAVSDSALDLMQVPPEKREEARTNLAKENAFGIHAIVQNMDSTIAYLRGVTKKLFQETEEYKQGLDTKGQWIYDNTVNLVDSMPILAAAVLSGGTAAFAAGITKAGPQAYGRAREAGYEPSESVARATVPSLIAGANAAVNAKIGLDISKPFMRRLFYNLAIDAGTDFTSPMLEFFADYATDNWYRTNQKEMLAPGDSLDKAFQRSLWNMSTGIGNSALFTTATAGVQAARMWAEGVKATKTNDGQVIIHPIEMTDMVDGMVSRNAFDGVDAQRTYEAAANDFMAAHRAAAKIEEISEIQRSRPLDDIDIDPQAGPSKKLGRLAVDMEVDVSPKYFMEKDNKPRNMGKPAKVVKTTYAVEETQQRILPGGVAPVPVTKKNYFVDVEFPDEPGVKYTIPRGQIVEKTRTPNSVPFEAPRLVRFMSELFMPRDLPYSEWTWEHARMALGGFLGVRESISRGALGSVKDNTGGIVWDAMRNNPEDAARILSHEPGHVLAEADSETLRSMGLADFEGFKEWLAKTSTSNDPEVKTRYAAAKAENKKLTLEDFILTEKYGMELPQLWKDWSLFKSKEPNARELAANALSVYMNDVMGDEAVPGFRSMKIREDISQWIGSNPNLKLAFEGLRAYDFSTPDSLNSRLSRGFRTSRAAMKGAAEAQQGERKTLLQELGDNFQNRLYSFLDRMNDDPAAVERVDKNLMVPGRAAHYVSIGYGETYKQLAKANINFEDYSNMLFWERLIFDRTRTVERLSSESQFANMDKYRKAYELESLRIRDELIDNNPDFTDAEIDAAAQAHMKQFAESEVVEEHVQLLNPEGFTADDAVKGLAELEGRYGPEKMALMRQRKAVEHQAFVDFGIPILRESKFFSERMLAHMAENSDYATFVVAHHAFNARGNKGANKGSLEFIHEQLGTLGLIADPHAQTALLRSRMIMAADQAGMNRDLVEMSSNFEAEHFPDAPRTRPLAAGEKIPNGYEEFKSKKYNVATGRVEAVRYAVRKGTIDGFYKAGEDSLLLSGLSTLHGAMKGWMTVYNPRFWFTNFVRDMARTTINAPGLKALYEIPYQMAKATAGDIIYKARGKENPEYKQMLLDSQLAGDVRAHSRIDNSMDAQDRMLLMADIDPKFFNKTWSQIEGFFDSLRYLYAKTTKPVRAFSEFIGGSVEYASKAAMKRYLDKHYADMPPVEKNWYIRNGAGTPVLLRNGRWNQALSNAFLFYNPNMQGAVGDWQALKRDPMANLFKRVSVVAGYMMLLSQVRQGERGEDLKKWAEGLPRAYFSRGFNIPMLMSADGDSATMILPTDPITRAMLAAAYNVIDKDLNGTFNALDIGGSVFGDTMEGLPSVAPVWKSLASLAEFVSGGNPEDYMGVPAMSPTLAASEDWGKKAMAMGTHFMQQGWGGPFNTMGFTPMLRAQFSTKLDKKQIKNPNSVEQFNSLLKDITGVPIVGYPLGGLVKFTSAGYKERAEDMAGARNRRQNSERLAVERVLQAISRGNPIKPEELALITSEEHKSFSANRLKDMRQMEEYSKLNRSDIMPLLRLLQNNPEKDIAAEYYLMILERLNKK